MSSWPVPQTLRGLALLARGQDVPANPAELRAQGRRLQNTGSEAHLLPKAKPSSGPRTQAQTEPMSWFQADPLALLLSEPQYPHQEGEAVLPAPVGAVED